MTPCRFRRVAALLLIATFTASQQQQLVNVTSSVCTAPFQTALSHELQEAVGLLSLDMTAGQPPLSPSQLLRTTTRMRALLADAALLDFRFGWLSLSKWLAELGDKAGQLEAIAKAYDFSVAAGDEGTACVALYNRGLLQREANRARAAATLEAAHHLCARNKRAEIDRYTSAAAVEASELFHALGDGRRADALLAAGLKARPEGNTLAYLKAGVKARLEGRLEDSQAWCARAALSSREQGQRAHFLTAVENLASLLVFDVRLPAPAPVETAADDQTNNGTSVPKLFHQDRGRATESSPLTRREIMRFVREAAAEGIAAIRAAAEMHAALSLGQGRQLGGTAAITASQAVDAMSEAIRYVRIILLSLAMARRDAAWQQIEELEDAALAIGRLCALLMISELDSHSRRRSSSSSSSNGGLLRILHTSCRTAAASWNPYYFLHTGASSLALDAPMLTVLTSATMAHEEESAVHACQQRGLLTSPSQTEQRSIGGHRFGGRRFLSIRGTLRSRSPSTTTFPLHVIVTSYDLRSNAMGYLVEGWARGHNASALSLSIYQYGPLDIGTVANASVLTCNADAAVSSSSGSNAGASACVGRELESIILLTPPQNISGDSHGAVDSTVDRPYATMTDMFIGTSQRFLAVSAGAQDATVVAQMRQRWDAGEIGDTTGSLSPGDQANSKLQGQGQQQLHFIVDMAGHFHGARTGVLACRPAPIQVSHMYPATTGIGAVDYLLTDRVATPVELHESRVSVGNEPWVGGIPPFHSLFDSETDGEGTYGQQRRLQHRSQLAIDELVPRPSLEKRQRHSQETAPRRDPQLHDRGSRFLLPPAIEKLVILPHSFQLNFFDRPQWMRRLRGRSSNGSGDNTKHAAETVPESGGCNSRTLTQALTRPLVFASYNTVDKLEPVTWTGWMNALHQSSASGSRLALLGSSLMGVSSSHQSPPPHHHHPSASNASGSGSAANDNVAVADGGAAVAIQPALTISQRLQQEAAARGVHPSRLLFAAQLPRSEHLQRLAATADIVLDPRWYSGHTSTTDALWTGAPVMALPGAHFPSRVSSSFSSASSGPRLHALLTSYDAKAQSVLIRSLSVGRAGRRLVLALRRRLHRAAESGPHLDWRGKNDDVERAYRAMWEQRAVNFALECGLLLAQRQLEGDVSPCGGSVAQRPRRDGTHQQQISKQSVPPATARPGGSASSYRGYTTSTGTAHLAIHPQARYEHLGEP